MCMLAVQVALFCVKEGIYFVIENPESSLMWVFPPMLELLAKQEVVRISLDYCQYGEEWKKPTTLATNCNALQVLERRCQDTGGRCSRTGLVHRELRGSGPDGTKWTKTACPCPFSSARPMPRS